MKPSYKTILATALAMIGSLITTPSAHAGFVDWINKDTQNQPTTITGSFNYAFALFKPDNASASVQDTYVAQPDQSTNQSNTVKAKTVIKGDFTVEMTGYSSDVGQTDDSPLITASNTYVRDGIIAANFLPFKTKVQFPEIFPGKTFVVEDRMNSRYNFENSGKYRIDVWFAERDTAIKFGFKRSAKMIVVTG